MSEEFKVGQRVKIRAWEDMENEFGVDFAGDIMTKHFFVSDMKRLCGMKAKIVKIGQYKHCELEFDKEVPGCYKWSFSTDMLEPLAETIVIYRKDSEVIALDKRTGEKAVAKCSPADTFDFEIGAKLAFGRLLGIDRQVEDDKKIKIGDTVEVIDTGRQYTNYDTWKGLGNYKQNWVNGSYIARNKVYKVLNIKEHGGFIDDVMALVQDEDTTQVFIIGLRGLEKIK